MNISYFKQLDVHQNLFSKDNNGREINIYRLDNCRPVGINLFYPNVLLITNDFVVLPLLERTMSLKSGTTYEKNDMKYKCSPIPVTNTYDGPLFFFVYNTDNYFHFLYDSLPYLISYLHLKKNTANLKLLMQYPNEQKNNFYPFVIEFLDLLNIKENDIALINPDTCYSEIYISTSYTHDIDSNLPPRQEIYSFYKEMVTIVELKYGHTVINIPQKIYVSRRTWLHNDLNNIGTNYTTRRRLVNEDELVESLVKDGYVEVFTERLSTIEKILYFSNATHVAGSIGGGISNVLFSPKNTHLEAFISPTFLDVNTRFKYSLDCVNVTYNTNSQHVEEGEFKTYMRVKTKDGSIMGEIEKIYDKKLLVSYTESSVTGWNAQNTFNQVELEMKDVERLDNGLNSPWKINL